MVVDAIATTTTVSTRLILRMRGPIHGSLPSPAVGASVAPAGPAIKTFGRLTDAQDSLIMPGRCALRQHADRQLWRALRRGM